MNMKDAAAEIRSRATDYLHRDGSGKGYVCPICGSGTGEKGTGLTTKDGVHFTCWRGCFTSADIIDIIGLEAGISADDDKRYPEKVRMAAQALHVTLDDEDPAQPRRDEPKKQPEREPERDTKPAQDFREYYAEARRKLEETDYPQRRGLSTETLKKYGVGYDRKERRLIIPCSDAYYVARAVDPDNKLRYKNAAGGSTELFNSSALYTGSGALYIVEGAIDALSIIEAGGEAVALNSVSTADKLIRMMQEKPTERVMFLALDNDTAGQQAEEKLTAAFQKLGITCYKVNPAGEYKDASERLEKDRDGLTATIRATTPAAIYSAAHSAAAELNHFMGEIAASVNTPSISTGFQKLDTELDGGMYPGLHIIGAISSLGKTTMCLQISDAVAAQGVDVLIFSLEMSHSELMAKSISRHTLQEILENGGSTANAKTTRGILDGKRYATYSRTERELIQTAVRKYGEYAGHIFISEGVGNIGAKEIREKVEEHRRMTGSAPVVLVDYLQILAPADPHSSDKQNTDKAVLELKRLSRDYNTPVIAVSALNRSNYSGAITMAAFKESGAIEYGADVLLGLQYQNYKAVGEELEEESRKDPREVELTILKQRNGRRGEKVQFEFYPMFNYFREQ